MSAGGNNGPGDHPGIGSVGTHAILVAREVKEAVVSKDKVAKVSQKSIKKGLQAPRANGKRAVPVHVSQDKVAKMAQDKQTKVIDGLTALAIKRHKTALKELERH